MSKLVNERRLLNTLILRISIMMCVLLIIAGLAAFFIQGNGRLPAIPVGSLTHIMRDVLHGASAWQASAFLDAALVILLLTPMMRLLAGIYVSMRMRDWLYAMIGTVVVLLVLIGLIAGQAGV